MYPLAWCPHLEGMSDPPSSVVVSQPCQECLVDKTKENWLCLICSVILCSRYVNNHMVKHNQNTGHALVLRYVSN